MNARRLLNAPLSVATALLLFSTAQASSDDRDYRMGDDIAETASDGATITTTYDSAGNLGQQQLYDLVATGTPVYRSTTGRPDGNDSLGVELNGSSFLRSSRVGLPSTTVSSMLSTTLNYNGLVNRGLQFWVQPDATNAQTMVMDTNQHGARINSEGNFSLRYAGVDYDSTSVVTANTWYHVMVVRPNGVANGAQMYVNGIAIAAAPGGYDGADTADLVVGANTSGDDGDDGGTGFTGGTEEFFDGIIDDLTLFVIGVSNEFAGPPIEASKDFGSFEFRADNDFVAFTLSGVAGDIDNSGVFDANDKADFINGWMNENLVSGLRAGDLNSFAAGDLNFDGITDIQDLLAFQALLPMAGLSTITTADLKSVPEPSTAMLFMMITATVPIAMRRYRHR